MNKHLKLLILLTGLFSFNSIGQGLYIGVESGYQAYQMNYLQELSIDIPRKIPFQTEIMSNYPPYWNTGCILGYSNQLDYTFGIRYNFASTGAKISRVDYSGEYEYLSLVNRNSIGAYLSLPFYKPTKLMSHFVLDAGYMVTYLKMKENIVLHSLTEESSEHVFNSNGLYITPAVSISYAIFPIRIGFRLGYEVNAFTNDFKGADFELHRRNSKDPKPNWSGVVCNFSISYNVSSIMKKD